MPQENRPLTAIRGVAALWVVAHHAQPGWAPGLSGFAASVTHLGYLAVDVFFILSGFIMAVVYAGITPAGAGRYWLRRALRVYPLHLCVMALLAAQAFGATLRNPALPPHPWHEYPAVLLLVQSYVLPNSPWNPPTWSVGVELACYALFPFTMPLLRRMPRWCLAPLILLLATAEWHVLRTELGAVVGAGAILRGLAGFALGAALARVAAPLSFLTAALGEGLAVLGIAAGLAWAQPGVVVLSAALLILCLSAQSGPVARLLSLRWCVWLGAVSFSIYLLHAMLIGFIDNHLPVPHVAWLRGLILLALLLPLSELTYRYIEQPGRHLAWRRTRQDARAAA